VLSLKPCSKVAV